MIFSDKNKIKFDGDILKEIEDGLMGANSAPVTLIDKTITANGTYNATDDEADGYSAVNVATIGLPKLVSPTTYSPSPNVITVNIPSRTFLMVPDWCNDTGIDYPAHIIVLSPIKSINFYYVGQGRYSTILFTTTNDVNDDVTFQVATGKSFQYKEDSPIKAGDYKPNTTYELSYDTMGQDLTIFNISVREYNEPISFTVE